jgi:hypothetical protein
VLRSAAPKSAGRDYAGLFDAFARIPGALEFADIENLADVVGVVGADVGDERGVGGELLIVGGFDGFFPVGENLIEFFDEVVPLGIVEVVKGVVVVAAEGDQLLAGEALEGACIPEPEMVGELANGVGAGGGSPFGLVGGETGDGDIGGDEPVFLIVRAVELLEENAAQGGGGLFGGLGGEGERKYEQQQESGLAHGGERKGFHGRGV